MEDVQYIVRFYRIDNKPVEEYPYWLECDAREHFNLFVADDSGLYAHIDLVEARYSEQDVVLQRIDFIMEVNMFKNGDLVTIKENFRGPGETDQLYRVVNVNEATKRCYIELAECNLPLSPQELVSFDMIHLFWTPPTKVHYNAQYVLEDESGTEYTEVSGSDYLMSQATGEAYRVSMTDEIDNPIEVEPLAQYLHGIERIMREEKCDRKTADRFYKLSRMLTSESFTAEQGKNIYEELKKLRSGVACKTAGAKEMHEAETHINLDKLSAYLADEMILEFASPEECMEYFNAHDGQHFASVDEMKSYQAEYGFGLGGKWYHISFSEALDVWERPPLSSVLESSQRKAGEKNTPKQEKDLEPNI